MAKIFIECNEIQVHTVQNQFHTHQHGNQISSGEETIHTNKKQCGADK